MFVPFLLLQDSPCTSSFPIQIIELLDSIKGGQAVEMVYNFIGEQENAEAL